MNKIQLAILLLLNSYLNAQTQVDVKTQTKNVDFSGAASTIPAKSGATLPASCNQGELFFKTSNPPGQNLYGCAPANTWSLLSGSSVTNGTVLAATTGQFGYYAANGTTIGGHTLTAADIPALNYQAPLTFTGTGAKTASSTGSATANNCAKWDANGNIIDAGAPCGSGSGSSGLTVPPSTTIGAVPQYSNTTGTAFSTGLGVVTVVNTPGSDSNLATEKAIRTAINGAVPNFATLAGGANTSAAMVVGSGSSLSATGGGTIAATSVPAGGVTGLAPSATTDTTNAANIVSGTLSAARLPNPSATTLGGVQSLPTVSHQFLTGISTSGVPSQAQPAASDISGLAPSATTDTTNASNIASGTLSGARLPNPSATTLGGVQSLSPVGHQFLTGISTSGIPSQAQPAASDISGLAPSATTDTTNASNITSGTLAAARLPNPSATTLGGVQSLSPVSHQFLTGISTSGVPSQAQPAASDISGLAASATTDTTNASNIASGTLAAARLPIVPVSNGGTGTATPGLIAGSNVTISGTWPNQTISSAAGASSASTVVQSSTHVAAGDSITYGFGASYPANSYAQKLAKDEGAVLTDRGVSGQLACDLADTQTLKSDNPGPDNNPIYTMMIGSNDANTKGTGAYEAVYHTCHQAALAWLAVPSTSKVAASTCTQTGSWTSDNRYAMTGATSTTNGSTLSCTIATTGGPLYAWYQLADSNGGTFTYAVDGGATASLSTATTPAIATQNGGTRGVGLLRVPGLAAGSHTILFTVTSATASSNSVGITAIGTPSPIATYGSPKVFTAGVPRQNGDGNSTLTSQYNTDALYDQTLLQGDGLGVYFVPVRNYLCTSIVSSTCYNSAGLADMGDPIHPNDTGHNDLKQAFEEVEQFSAPTKPQQLASNGTTSTDQATLSAELTSASNAASTGWTGTYNSFTNGSSNTSPLSFAVGAALGNYYQTVVTISGMSAGALTVSIGGASVGVYSSNGTYTSWIQAVGTGAFTLTPTSSFNGVVAVSAKQLTPIGAFGITARDSTGANSFEALQTLATLQNTYIGGGGTFTLTGASNTANGYQALFNNVMGSNNVATGFSALYSNQTGNYNVAEGPRALYSNTSGSNNTGIGFWALQNNTTGYYNTAIGFSALNNATTASYNTAIGSQAAQNTTTGGGNTAIGNQALFTNTTGSNNTALGSGSLYTNSGGTNNTAVGNSALLNTSSGSYNSGFGVSALQNNSTGGSNTAHGYYALVANTSGTSNTCLGYECGYYAGGNYATSVDTQAVFLGANASRDSSVPTATALTNIACLGFNCKVGVNNTVEIGNRSNATVILNGHVVPGSTGTSPTLSACGTSPTIASDSTDAMGTVTIGSGGSGCTVTFHSAFTAPAPHCTVSSQTFTLTAYTESATALTVTGTGTFDYHCLGK